MRKLQLTVAAAAAAVGAAMPASAATWEVTVTNLTAAQSFTPLVVMTHPRRYEMFTLGEPADEALEAMAEGGDTSMIQAQAAEDASDIQSTEGLLGPGQSVTVSIEGEVRRSRLSIAGMLLPTNDNFVALNGVRLPRSGSKRIMALAYDAGTEVNDQNCRNIPGPLCGGEGVSVDGGEGHVHVGTGIHDLGEEDADGFQIIGPMRYDWRNPVAMVTVRIVH
jgi:hypothetical protein